MEIQKKKCIDVKRESLECDGIKDRVIQYPKI